MSTVRTRFAPSPTGFVHIGGLRTALYNYLFARQNNGSFILRIEDTDRTRFVEGATENIIHTLEWAGIKADEGPGVEGPSAPYFQSQRLDIYRKFAYELIAKGYAYYAFDMPEEIEAMRSRFKTPQNPTPKYDFQTRLFMRNSLSMNDSQVKAEIAKGTQCVIRLLIPENHTFEFNDIIRGTVIRHSNEVDDQVLLKSDGFPTYHLANVVDDHLMDITHIIRGEEWLSSVPKHLWIYKGLGWTPPLMAHLPLIFNPDGTKMSKRDIQFVGDMPPGKVDPDVATYIHKVYDREAVINTIALLGWNPGEGDERQIFTMEELVHEFSLERVNKAAAIFDVKKLNWINKEYVKRRNTCSLVAELKEQLAKQSLSHFSDDYLEKIIELFRPRINFSHEIYKKSHYFFKDPPQVEKIILEKHGKGDTVKLVLEFYDEIAKLESFNAQNIEAILRKIAERNNVGTGQIIHPVRLIVSGTDVGPGLFEMLQVLGKDTVLRRLKKAREFFSA